jgi:peptidoglycan/xylan/chitin deacetylase (PgdA/CDA1 family)
MRVMEKLVRRGLALPAKVPGVLPAIRYLRSQSVAIVMYHGVIAKPVPVSHWCLLELSRFEEQIQFLAQEYNVIPLPEAIDRLSQGLPLPERSAVVTFDDGLRNVYTTAFPVLRRYQMPASVFLVTSLIESGRPTWLDRLYLSVIQTSLSEATIGETRLPLATDSDRAAAYSFLCEYFKRMPNPVKDEKLEQFFQQVGHPKEGGPDSPVATLAWTEIEELVRSGLITFGSHTHTHPILSQCDPESQREELRLSRDILGEHLGKADLFAYPNGSSADFTEVTKGTLKELGYGCALATEPGLNRVGADLFALRRVNVANNTSFKGFELLMAGL